MESGGSRKKIMEKQLNSIWNLVVKAYLPSLFLNRVAIKVTANSGLLSLRRTLEPVSDPNDCPWHYITKGHTLNDDEKMSPNLNGSS